MKNLLLTLFIVFSFNVVMMAQSQGVIALNEIGSEIQYKTNEPEKVYYKLNEEYFTEKNLTRGLVFQFSLSSDRIHQYEVTRVSEYYPGYISVIAKRKGVDQGVMSFTYHNGGINGLLHESHDRSLVLSYDKDRNENFIQESGEQSSGNLACGLHEDSNEFVAPLYDYSSNDENRSKTARQTEQYQPSLITSSIDDSVTIDLMLVYTNAARDWAANESSYRDIFEVMSQAMTLSQTALDNSKTGIELRLVHTHRTSYDEINDGVESGVRLRRLTQDDSDPVFDDPDNEFSGHMEEVHDLRDQYGADIVSLIARIIDTGGLGWRLSSTGGNPQFGFNLNRVQQVGGGFTLIHEIGHNMGNSHARTQALSPATEAGGLFHYSVGFQDQTNNFHTVMAYADGLNQAPIFSSPDLTWLGFPTGTTNNRTPEDNALSMREIKKTISGYRTTMEDSPIAALSTEQIEVNLNQEDELMVSVDISNNGSSNLMWDIDFDFPGNTVGKRAKVSNLKTIEPVDMPSLTTIPYNFSQRSSGIRSKVNTNELIYETSFESIESFETGTFLGQNQWRSLNDTEFSISSTNPKTGSQNLSIAYSGGGTKFIASPFFGYRLFGNYEVTINFSLTGSGALSETFDFYINDGKTGDMSAGVIISEGGIFLADINESGQRTFLGIYGSVTPNIYHELKIIYNTDNQSIDYYYDGSLLASNSYLSGFTPGVVQVLHRNQQIGTAINVDDIRVEQMKSPYSWLAAPDPSGIVFDSEAGQIDFEFNTAGVSSGTYETIMKVKTNDPASPMIEVPITLNVGVGVSNEVEDRPIKMELVQNYPNPFNPTTTINYSLTEPQTVNMEVFNIQGQKVATLLNDERVSAGTHNVVFDASTLSSGIYIYQLKTGRQTLTKQMVLIK
ncbi:T9SS type A sorting domain-containing protein [Gracilimonas amylolytica]|uniref:T9SS type A sorting domain-containing protein n=1 Tax=Gracilimonas amylolytica TaxID=1749045 RepID=UPI000CD85067|nr:T9SS type A sorting domain-containing protein [Gracilimonas amylolytica]